jgi:ribosomal protein S18 acetylase RimI-like enzyme
MEQSPSLYANYIKEREGIDILEMFYGFMTYKLMPEAKTVYLRDCYVLPQYRGQAKVSEMAEIIEKIAFDNGCTISMTSVDLNTLSASKNLKTYLGYGFNVGSVQNNHMMYLTRTINLD